MLGLYADMEGLYKQLHAYVRRQLYNVYGDDVIDLEARLYILGWLKRNEMKSMLFAGLGQY